jgi:hypothetical protein
MCHRRNLLPDKVIARFRFYIFNLTKDIFLFLKLENLNFLDFFLQKSS